MSYTIDGFGPSDLLTSPKDGTRRVKVDVGSSGFFEARTFRISYEFSTQNGNEILNAASRWLRITSPVNFLLQRQEIGVDDGAVRVRIFRAGVESGTWSPVNVAATNLANAAGYAGQITIDDGGAVDTTGEIAVETLRIRTAGSNRRTTISAAASDERLIIPGTYYIQIENIAAGINEGVFTLGWEELP